MKTLQNNFTTPEQSKRLLELGVPADSADMGYQALNGNVTVMICADGEFLQAYYSLQSLIGLSTNDIPVDRLVG